MSELARPDISELRALGYVGVASSRVDEWRGFATDLLGMQVADTSSSTLTLRMDDRRQRVMVTDDVRGFFGWEVSDAAGLNQLASRLDAAGVPYKSMPSSQLGQRFIADGIVFHDPVGNQLEAFHGAELAHDPFVPGRAVSGFKTGPLGLGHAVLTAPDIEPMIAFYQDLLGFRLSDYVVSPFKAYFFHLNERHHSLALVEAADVGIHHLMVEMMMLDDVGQGYDIAQLRPNGVGVTLGRHTNDHMLSFYANTPSGFLFEYGFGGLLLNPDEHEPVLLTDGPSLWGHDRNWLSAEGREEARQMRMAAAARGVKAPIHVTEGNYDVMECAWWGNLKAAGPVVSQRRGQ